MIITSDDIKTADQYFTLNPDALIPYGIKMFTKHTAITVVIQFLENWNASKILMDNLKYGVIVICFVIEEINNIEMEPIIEKIIIEKAEHYASFLKYFLDSDEEEKKTLKFLTKELDMSKFAVFILNESYKLGAPITLEVLMVFFAIMKCFEDILDLIENGL